MIYKATFLTKIQQLKNNGDKLDRIQRLEDVIEKYVRASCPADMDYKKRLSLKNSLLDYGEKQLDVLVCKQRDRQVTKAKKYTNQQLDYKSRVSYIDGNIEHAILYFDESNRYMKAILDVKAQCRKNNFVREKHRLQNE